MNHKKAPQAFALAVVLAMLPGPAWAYLDPGSVSLWLQGLLAALAAAGATYRLWWSRLRALLGRDGRSPAPSAGDRAPPHTHDADRDGGR